MTGAPDAGCRKMNRRSFLGWASAALGSLIAAVLGGTGGVYFLSPAFEKREEDWVDVGPITGFSAGSPAKVEFTQRRRDGWVVTERRASAWVLTPNGRDFTVYDPRCTHLGCPYRWDEASGQFLCPCHTAAFSIDGGVVKGPPPRALDRYAAKVRGGRLLVRPDPIQAPA